MTEQLTHTEDRFAYDLANQSLVVVTDADVGTVGEQKPAMQDLIRRAGGNRVNGGYDDDTRCVEVQYVEYDGDDNPRSYTMPANRIIQQTPLLDAIREVNAEAGIDNHEWEADFGEYDHE